MLDIVAMLSVETIFIKPHGVMNVQRGAKIKEKVGRFCFIRVIFSSFSPKVEMIFARCCTFIGPSWLRL